MRKLNVVMMTVAGLLLMAAAVLKFHEVMNVAIPSWDVRAQVYMDEAAAEGQVLPAWKANALGFFESYEFFLIQIPLEFALGAWMVCGLFRKAAWLAGTCAYFGFIGITLAKALLGFESCGCFGQVHVDPWVTLFAVDIPFFVLLAIFRPKGHKLLPPPWPNVGHAIVCAVPILAVLVLAAPMVVTFRPEFKKPVEQTELTAEAKLKLQAFQHKQEKAQWQKQAATLQQTNERLQAEMTSQERKIRDLESKLEVARRQLQRSYDVNEIRIHEAGFYNSKALVAGAKFQAATQAMGGALWLAPTDDPDIFEISVNPGIPDNPRVILTLDLSEKGKMILIPSDPNSRDIEAAKAQEIIPDEPVKVEPDAQVQVESVQPDNTAAVKVKPDVEIPAADVEQWEWLEFVVEDEVREKISEGLAIVLMYHHDCPTCADVVPAYSKYYAEMAEQGNDAFKIAFLAVPPYAETGPVPEDTTCILGKMTDKEKWEVMSPYVVALLDGELMKSWKQGTAPEPEKILDEVFGQ